MQVGKRGRGLSARDSIHSTTLGSVRVANRLVRQEMSRTPSCTMQYYYITGQLARTLIVRAKPARCIGNPHSRRLWRQPLYENTRTPGIYRSTNGSVMKYERSSLVIGRLLCNIISGDCTNLYGGFGVFGPKYYQIWSESRLMGPVCWKKCSSEILSSIKSHQMFFLPAFFNHFKK